MSALPSSQPSTPRLASFAAAHSYFPQSPSSSSSSAFASASGSRVASSSSSSHAAAAAAAQQAGSSSSSSTSAFYSPSQAHSTSLPPSRSGTPLLSPRLGGATPSSWHLPPPGLPAGAAAGAEVRRRSFVLGPVPATPPASSAAPGFASPPALASPVLAPAQPRRSTSHTPRRSSYGTPASTGSPNIVPVAGMPRQRPALASPAQGDGTFSTPGGEARPASAPPRRGTMPTPRSIRRSIERPLALEALEGFSDGLGLPDDDGLKEEDPLATAWAALGPKRRSVGTLVALSAAALAARETLAGSWGAVALSSLSLHPHLPLLHVTRALSLLAVLPCARLDMASRLRVSWLALCLLGAGHVCIAGLLAPRALLLASIAAECGAQALVVLGTVTLSDVAGRDARIATAALGLLKSVGVAASALLLGGTRVDSAGGWRTSVFVFSLLPLLLYPMLSLLPSQASRFSTSQLSLFSHGLLLLSLSLLTLPPALSAASPERHARSTHAPLLFAGAALSLLFFATQCRTRLPLVSHALLASRAFWAGAAALAALAASTAMLDTYLPSFLYAAHNTAPLAQQFISALRPFFLGVCALPIALLTRYTGHVKALAIGGALTFLTGMGLMFGTNGEAASLSRMALAQFLLGAGEALCFGVTEALVLSNVSASLSSTLHMSLLLVTAVGRALGASFCGALWAARLPGLLNSALLPLHAHNLLTSLLAEPLTFLPSHPLTSPERAALVNTYVLLFRASIVAASTLAGLALLAVCTLPDSRIPPPALPRMPPPPGTPEAHLHALDGAAARFRGSGLRFDLGRGLPRSLRSSTDSPLPLAVTKAKTSGESKGVPSLQQPQAQQPSPLLLQQESASNDTPTGAEIAARVELEAVLSQR